ncbi:MAG: hypothetical protein WKF77_04390, partial [Planctomycetaceae bacterium]
GGTIRIGTTNSLVCTALECVIDGEASRHALLIPNGIDLDLNGSTLLLDLRSNSHGVRLSSRSSIRNGTIRVIHSENKGSQAIWHAGIGIGAPYDDGGTPAKPSRFSRVSDWKIENITIDQPFPAAAIQIMSEACHGIIRDVRILDSPKALLGIGMDWGSVGKITSADETIPHMRELWERHEIYTTHPHDILIEDIDIGHLTRNDDGNNAGIRCSACYNIQIRNVHVASAASAVAIFGGDCGFEFAPLELRPLAHTGYAIDGLVIDKAFRYGIVLNGLADNVFRSSQTHGYQTLIDPTQPGLNGITISNSQLSGDRTPDSYGMFITSVSHAEVRDVTLKDFAAGVRIKDWIDGLHFRNTDLSDNDQPRSIFSSTGHQKGLIFD